MEEREESACVWFGDLVLCHGRVPSARRDRHTSGALQVAVSTTVARVFYAVGVAAHTQTASSWVASAVVGIPSLPMYPFLFFSLSVP